MPNSRALPLVVGLIVIYRVAAVAEDAWPGPALLIADGTISPNGRYAIGVPAPGAIDKDDSRANQLADIVGHRLLGKIPGTDLWGTQISRSLKAWWAPDSSWCAAAYYNRLGFDACVVVELHDDSFTAIQIDQQIQHALETGIKKQSRNPGEDRGEGLFLRPRDHTLLVRAFATTNPKGMEGEKTYEFFFSGSYDVAANKWAKLNVRPLDPKVNIGASLRWPDGELVRVMPPNAPWPTDFNGEVVHTEEQRAKALDQMLNESYAAVRFVTPPARFAKIKEEQKAWLARWVLQKSLQEKNAMTDARVHQLREILWEE